jgi:hypothetical protein
MMIVEQSVECELAEESEVLGKKPSPMPLCPPQIPHDPTWARNRAAAEQPEILLIVLYVHAL